ncbi:hypothetical protein [Priestia megaterium]|uniref:hypothetical protein n=1 Tax=Priestia megaterium TaxID=1404 RepID=UPI000BFBA3A5|nr:hypothetical protein [Priestia megaterium]PGO60673.1 hypothetical protein CN981_08980 [Priestia megaterium]
MFIKSDVNFKSEVLKKDWSLFELMGVERYITEALKESKFNVTFEELQTAITTHNDYAMLNVLDGRKVIIDGFKLDHFALKGNNDLIAIFEDENENIKTYYVEGV